MPRSIQNPEAARALQQQFSLRGRIGIALDEVAVPVQDLGDFAGRNPFAPRRLGMDGQQSPAVIGRFSAYFVTAALNTELVVESLLVSHPNAAATTLSLILLRPIDVAAINVSATGRIARTNGRIVPSTGFIEQIAATASLADAAAAAIGAQVGQVRLPDATQATPFVEIPMPRGVILSGADGLSFGVVNTSVNQTFLASVAVTEYPVQG
jgi:hypothetical protein